MEELYNFMQTPEFIKFHKLATEVLGKTRKVESKKFNKQYNIKRLKGLNFWKKLLIQMIKFKGDLKMVVEGIIKSNKGFYVGDPCYVLSDEIYRNFWGEVCNWKVGIHSVPTTGEQFAVNETAYGDGEYFDEYGRVYGVDSGTLSVIPLELVEDISHAKYCGYVTEKSGSVDFCFYNGLFTVDFEYEKFTIDTNGSCDEKDFDDWDGDKDFDEENEEE